MLPRRAYRAVFGPIRGGRRPGAIPDLSLAVPFGFDLGSAPAPAECIAVICHMFYAELAPEFRQLVANIPFAADIFISTDTEAKKELITRAFEGWDRGSVEVRISPNRGRDIAPKLISFRDVYDSHDLVLFLHGKRSTTSTVGDHWRRTLTRSLAGSPDIVLSIIDIFRRHPEIGIVMAQHFEPIRQHLHWDGNFAHARQLARRMGIRLTRRHVLDLPSGSMFWVRSAALRPLLDLNLDLEDFPEEAGQIRKTNQHAIERLMLFVCEHAGFSWTKVADPSCFQDRSQIVSVSSREEVDEVIARSRLTLLRA